MKDNQKVYIRGVKGRGEEVIKMLEEHGGGNICLDGENPDYLYFINHKGFITRTALDCEYGQIVSDNYTELRLPEKWKNGDVLVSRFNSQVMALYEFVSDKDADLFNAYFRIDDNMIFSHSLEVRNRFRLATDQEIERFYELLHKHHKDWDAENKRLLDWRWKPKLNETYWLIWPDGHASSGVLKNDNYDNGAYDFGNCFRSREEAEAMAEKVKKLLKGE